MMASQRGLSDLLPRLVASGGAAALAMRGGRLLGCPLHFAAEHAPLDTVRFLVTAAPEGGCTGGWLGEVVTGRVAVCSGNVANACRHHLTCLVPSSCAAAAVCDANGLLPVRLGWWAQAVACS